MKRALTDKKRPTVEGKISIAASAVNEDRSIIICRVFARALTVAEVSAAEATSASSDNAARIARRFMMMMMMMMMMILLLSLQIGSA